MTTANKITLVRIAMIPVFVALAIYYGESVRRGAPLEWQRFAAIIVFLLAAVSDGLDGYVARRYNQRSRLGVILDPIADKGLLLSGIITLSITNWSQSDPDYGKFPVWFPVLVITRDAVILVGAAILHYFIGNKMRVKPSWTGKVATVCQMCAIAWVMLQLRFLPLWFVVIGLKNGQDARLPHRQDACATFVAMNTAIIGRPNVGKSALFNRIAGRRIAIVHGQPGITRDRISAKCEIGGKTFALWDAGGIVGAGETQLTGDVRAAAELAMKIGRASCRERVW